MGQTGQRLMPFDHMATTQTMHWNLENKTCAKLGCWIPKKQNCSAWEKSAPESGFGHLPPNLNHRLCPGPRWGSIADCNPLLVSESWISRGKTATKANVRTFKRCVREMTKSQRRIVASSLKTTLATSDVWESFLRDQNETKTRIRV